MRFLPLFILVVCLLVQVPLASAQKIPPHLAAMTASLVNEIKGSKMDSSEDPVLKDTAQDIESSNVSIIGPRKPVDNKGGNKKAGRIHRS